MSMSMSMTPVASWFANLPLSDPRCRNDSCIAFKNGHTASQAAVSYNLQFEYGHWVVYIWSGIVIVYIFLYVLGMIENFFGQARVYGPPTGWQKIKAFLRSINYRRISAGPFRNYFNPPSLGISILMTLFVATTFIMAFAVRPYYRQFRGFGSPPLGVRTGLMSAAMIPICLALGGKVNLITILTGIGHEKLNIFHRWAGFLMILMGTIHTIPFFICESKEEILYSKFYSPGAFEFTGTPGWAISLGILGLSIPMIRRKFYELFYWTHYILAITFLGLMFWHFDNEGDSMVYLWATVAIWSFNIVTRIFWGNATFKLSNDWGQGCPTVIKHLADDVMRIEVLVPSQWRWRPGQHVFLRFLKLNPLDNHPFTIASTPNSKDNVMVFLARSYKGATGDILNHIKLNPDVQLSAMIDGPYGSKHPKFENQTDHVLLVAGGVGISAVLPILTHLSRAMSSQDCTIRSLKLAWMVRHASDFGWVEQELQQALRNSMHNSITVEIHVTRETKKETVTDLKELKHEDKTSGSDDESGSEVSVDGVRFHASGRPHLAELIPTLVGEGRTAVIACGPDGLKIDLSNAVARLQKRVLKDMAQEITLYTETYDW